MPATAAIAMEVSIDLMRDIKVRQAIANSATTALLDDTMRVKGPNLSIGYLNVSKGNVITYLAGDACIYHAIV